MKELEDENRRLKKMYIEEKLIAEIAKDIIEKVVKPDQRRELAKQTQTECSISIRIACNALSINVTAMCINLNKQMRMQRLLIGCCA